MTRESGESTSSSATTVEAAIVVDDDVSPALVEAVAEYDTVCVGLSERGEAKHLEFGSTARRVSRDAPGNVAVVRGATLIDPARRDETVAGVAPGSGG